MHRHFYGLLRGVFPGLAGWPGLGTVPAGHRIYGGFCGLVGARLWDVFFFDWAYYSHHLSEIPFVWQGGMAIQGGIVGGVLAGALYCRYHKVNWLEMLDIICQRCSSASPSAAWPTC